MSNRHEVLSKGHEFFSQMRANMYYIIIFALSIIVMIFFPMFGAEEELALKIPSTFAGWCVYITTKLIVGIINIIIFHSFMKQAVINIKDNEKYLEALRILGMYNLYGYNPMGPREWLKQQYGQKGTTIFVTSVLSAFTLSQALLTYDYITAISYFITLTLGVVFGILQMTKAEEYWTGEFYDYAKKIEKEFKEKEALANANQG